MIVGRDIDRTLEITDEPVLETNRYWDMVASLPQGDFYSKAGLVIPKRSGPYRFKFTAPDIAGRNFYVSINGVRTRTILTDVDGIVEFSDLLVAGPGGGFVTVRIEDTVETGRALLAYLTVTSFAFIEAAEAAVINDIDSDITGVHDDSFLSQVSVDDIESKFGSRVLTERAAVWGIDAYRELLEEIFQAYDIFSGTDRGLTQVVGAITQVPPTIYERNAFGSRWVLGYQYLRNNEYALDADSDGSPDDWYIDAGSATMVIDVAGAGLTSLFADQRLQVTATGVGDAAVISAARTSFAKHVGFEFTFTAWVESVAPVSIVVGLSDDGGASWEETAVPIVTVNSPTFVKVKKLVGVGATSLLARVRQVGSIIGDVWFIERTALFVKGVTSLYLGDSTTPHSIRQSALGRLLLWWSPDVLTSEEMTLDGISDFIQIVQGGERVVGHIQRIVPAHVEVVDRDVTLRCITASTIVGLKISYLYPGMATGTANIDWDTTTNELRWAEPTEVGWGAAVTITESGLYVLKSVSGRDSVVVAVDFTALDAAPSASQALAIESSIKGAIYLADWSAGTSRIGLDIISRTLDRFSYLKPAIIYDELIPSQPTTVTGVTIDSVTANTLTGDGTLDFNFATTSLSWAAPGDQLGTPLVIGADGTYDLQSWNGINSIQVTVVLLSLPVADQSDSITIVGGDIVDNLISERTEILAVDSMTGNADLTYQTTQDQSKALMLEDGLALPADQWTFTGAMGINIFAPVADAVYQLSYEVLMQFETGAIDLGVNFESFAWMFDAYIFERYEKNIIEVAETQELVFNRDTLTALLRFDSNLDIEASQLTQTLDGVTSVVSTTQWSFADIRTVGITGVQYNVNATYVFNYVAKKTERSLVPRVEFEEASSPDGVAFGGYAAIERGDLIDATERYHRIRAKVFDVIDIRDVRIKSLVLKGLRLISDAPGI